MAKLDMYDYNIVFSEGHVSSVLITVDSLHDPIIADISGEIAGNEGFLYVEGHYLKFIEMSLEVRDSIVCLNVKVLEI